MITIGLDMAVRTVGIAVQNGDNPIVYKSYTNKEKDYFKLQIGIVDWVFGEIQNLVGYSLEFMTSQGMHFDLIMEDLYVGLDPTSALDAAKSQGAVIDRYYRLTNKFPIIIGPIAARKLVGIDSRASKAEIQLAVVDKLKICTNIDCAIRGEIIQARNHYELIKKRVKSNAGERFCGERF